MKKNHEYKNLAIKVDIQKDEIKALRQKKQKINSKE